MMAPGSRSRGQLTSCTWYTMGGHSQCMCVCVGGAAAPNTPQKRTLSQTLSLSFLNMAVSFSLFTEGEGLGRGFWVRLTLLFKVFLFFFFQKNGKLPLRHPCHFPQLNVVFFLSFRNARHWGLQSSRVSRRAGSFTAKQTLSHFPHNSENHMV